MLLVYVRKGSPFNITHVNDLGQDYEGNDVSITVHHHGLHIKAAFDGHPAPDQVSDVSFGVVPEGMIHPSRSFTYETTNAQEPGTFWYHDHTLHRTARNVVMGLAGFFIIKPDDNSLYDNVQNLPSGEFEIALALQDRKFDRRNQFDYPMNFDEFLGTNLVQDGYLGDTMLVNGVHAPYLDVKQGLYRFRILNGCNARQLTLEVHTSGGARRNVMYQIGTEGGHISSPVQRPSLDMAPGERYDILVDFRSFDAGTNLYLRNVFGGQEPFLPEVLQFRIGSGSVPSYEIPSSLVSYSFPDNPDVIRRMRLASDGMMHGGMMGGGMMGGGMTGPYRINGVEYDPNVANLQVRRGSTETWIIQSSMMSMHPHPMHLHLVQFHINGISAGSLEDGWKDTVLIPDHGGARSITATFDGEPGIYMFHCHNLEHEDWDMMLQFEICDDNSPGHPCNPGLLYAEFEEQFLSSRSSMHQWALSCFCLLVILAFA